LEYLARQIEAIRIVLVYHGFPDFEAWVCLRRDRVSIGRLLLANPLSLPAIVLGQYATMINTPL
jgi:hypothetical protein